ncbi:MAG TPA: hypothetical protein PK428_12385, partial [Phycicoccus sp.]|nr:hypothetical protein [Phycicoccus sp.]
MTQGSLTTPKYAVRPIHPENNLSQCRFAYWSAGYDVALQYARWHRERLYAGCSGQAGTRGCGVSCGSGLVGGLLGLG